MVTRLKSGRRVSHCQEVWLNVFILIALAYHYVRRSKGSVWLNPLIFYTVFTVDFRVALARAVYAKTKYVLLMIR
jgi:hypothetical protein